nr:hypothetical protein [Pirellula staleyi]
MLGGLAVIGFFLFRTSRGFLFRAPSKSTTPAEIQKILGERSRDSALADAPAEVLRWHVELHDTARDLKAELDSKLAAIQAATIAAKLATQEAEAAIAQLQDERRALETLRREQANS